VNFCFDFSKTVMPFVSFQDMGVMSMRLTVILGSFMIAIFLLCLQSILFVISWPFKNKLKLVYRFHNMMKTRYFWRGGIRLFIESYFELCVAIMLSFRAPRFDKPSDIYDFAVTVFFAFVVIAGPIALFKLMKKHGNELDKTRF
jgi:hypothetical protein